MHLPIGSLIAPKKKKMLWCMEEIVEEGGKQKRAELSVCWLVGWSSKAGQVGRYRW